MGFPLFFFVFYCRIVSCFWVLPHSFALFHTGIYVGLSEAYRQRQLSRRLPPVPCCVAFFKRLDVTSSTTSKVRRDRGVGWGVVVLRRSFVYLLRGAFIQNHPTSSFSALPFSPPLSWSAGMQIADRSPFYDRRVITGLMAFLKRLSCLGTDWQHSRPPSVRGAPP